MSYPCNHVTNIKIKEKRKLFSHFAKVCESRELRPGSIVRGTQIICFAHTQVTDERFKRKGCLW